MADGALATGASELRERPGWGGRSWGEEGVCVRGGGI